SNYIVTNFKCNFNKTHKISPLQVANSLQSITKDIQIKFLSLCYISHKVYYLSCVHPLEIATSTL
ncbi:hypothetical protein, partial [Borreliella garinii]|uniref:hypothetical protein n=1 Tax=Borreliella garinii TaxID=29519 RepID=UPI001AEFB2EA